MPAPTPHLLARLAVLVLAPAALAQQPQHFAHIELTRGRPVVMVTVDGKGPFRFVVDTGTGGQAVVTPQLARKLHLAAAGFAELSDPSGAGSQSVPRRTIPSIRVAGVEFAGVLALEHSLGDMDSACDGLLGFTLFRDYLLALDYPNRRLTLDSGSLQPDGGQRVLPFHMPYGVPLLELRVDDRDGETRIDAQIDSGGGGLSFPARLTSRLRLVSVEGSSKVQSLLSRFTVNSAQMAGNVRFGVYTLRRPFIELNAGFPLANFGSSPMRHFALTFDQRNPAGPLVRFDARQETVDFSVPEASSQPAFAAGEWQTPGISISYETRE
jgi:hypothetical protein